MADFSKVDGINPTKTITSHYAELMAEMDPAKLAADVLELVTKHGGIAPKNLMKVKVALRDNAGNLDRLRSYVTNFMLAGMGMGVNAGSRGCR